MSASNQTVPDFVLRPDIYLKQNRNTFMVLDFETTLDQLDASAVNDNNSIVLACWYLVHPDGTVERKHCFGNEYEQHKLVEDCYKVDFIVAHNAKFEAGYLKRCGVDLRRVLVYCTMLAEWVLNGNRKLPLQLNALAKRYKLGTKEDLVSTLIKSGVCPADIPKDWLLTYCWQDVTLAYKVFLKQIVLLKRNKLLHIAHTRNLATLVLADVEFEGMTLDAEAVIKEYESTKRRRNYLAQELISLTNDINLASPVQVATYLYDTLQFKELQFKGKPLRTAGGSRLTDSVTLSKLEATTEDQAAFLTLYREFNKADSLISKNLEFFYRTVLENNANFKAKFQQGVTVTHRLSSAGIPTLFKNEKKSKSVQFQNLPRDYKRLFWAGDDDWLIGECDGAQLEFRVAADVCKDETADSEIRNGSDIHSVTAQVLSDAGEPTTRQQAKASTFAPLYGGMGKTPAQKAYAAFFKEKYKGISSTQRAWCLQAASNKRVRLPWGMVFYWPNASMDKNGYINVSTEVHNYPIQSFATGEIIPIALSYFWYRSRDLPIHILNTIHDSIVTRIKKGYETEFEELSKQCLTTDVFNHLKQVYGYSFETPLGVGIKMSRNWGATKEETVYSVLPNGEFTKKQ